MRAKRSRPTSATPTPAAGETPLPPAPRTIGELHALLDAARRIVSKPGRLSTAARRDLETLLRSASRYKRPRA